MGKHGPDSTIREGAGLGSQAAAAAKRFKISCDRPSKTSYTFSLPYHTVTMLPDLVASSTSRPDTQETAAYAASQPLFDVLRGAIYRIDEQKALLTGAKDTVQHIHVKVPQEHVENNGLLPNDYRDSLVTAWKVTTESFVRIFEQLCELTGPDPAAGRQAEDSYAGFQKLLCTAEAARTVAFEQDAENMKAKDKAESGSESQSSASSKAATPKKTQQTPADVASTKRPVTSDTSPSQNMQRPAKKQRTTEGDASATPVTKATDSAKQQPIISTAQRLKPKQIRKDRKRRNQQQQAAMPPQAAVPPPQPVEPIAQAQYADVTAELDARLRAKEEQKKAKKQAKKRKRDSHGSNILEAEPGAEQEAEEARIKILAQKPAKKRSKSENGEGVRVNAEKNLPAKGKRGIEVEAVQAQAAGEGTRRSKRRKA
jgi:hypothetical protein